MDLRLLKKCTRLVSESSIYWLHENRGSLIIKSSNIGEEAFEDYRIPVLDTLKFEESSNYFCLFSDLKQLLSKKEIEIAYFHASNVNGSKDILMKVYNSKSYKTDFELVGSFFSDSNFKDQETFAVDTLYLKKLFRFFGKDMSINPKIYLTEKYLCFKNGEYEVFLFLVESSKIKEYLKEVN